MIAADATVCDIHCRADAGQPAVSRAASDPERLSQMGLAAREKAKSYSSDIMVERTESLYSRLFQARGIPA